MKIVNSKLIFLTSFVMMNVLIVNSESANIRNQLESRQTGGVSPSSTNEDVSQHFTGNNIVLDNVEGIPRITAARPGASVQQGGHKIDRSMFTMEGGHKIYQTRAEAGKEVPAQEDRRFPTYFSMNDSPVTTEIAILSFITFTRMIHFDTRKLS